MAGAKVYLSESRVDGLENTVLCLRAVDVYAGYTLGNKVTLDGTEYTANEVEFLVTSGLHVVEFEYISREVSKLVIKGTVLLGGKQRTPLPRLGYDTVRPELDAGITAELVDIGGDFDRILARSSSVVPATAGDPNYALPVSFSTLAQMNLINGTYVIHFSRLDGSPANTRDESYLNAEVLLDLSGIDISSTAANPLNPNPLAPSAITLVNADNTYAAVVMAPGSYVLNAPAKSEISVADARTIKALVGYGDSRLDTTVYNINEYLGVDAADYATVEVAIGRMKNVGKAILTNSNAGGTVTINTAFTTW